MMRVKMVDINYWLIRGYKYEIVVLNVFIFYIITMWNWSIDSDIVYGPGDDNYGRDRVGYMDEREKAYCHFMLRMIVRHKIPFLAEEEKELSPEQFKQEIEHIWSEYIRWIVWSNKNITKDIREEFIELLLTDIKLNINGRDIPSEQEGVATKLVEVMQATYELYKTEKAQWVKWPKWKEMELHALLSNYRKEK